MTKFHQIPSLLSCPTVSYQNNTKIAIFFAVNKNEVALISSKLSQLTGWFRVKFWRGIAYFVQNNTTIIQPGDTRRIRASYHAMPDAVDAFFGAKLGAWSKTLLHIFHLLQSDMVFGNVFPFNSWKVNAISSKKSYLISMPFTCPFLHKLTSIMTGKWNFSKRWRVTAIRLPLLIIRPKQATRLNGITLTF